MRRSAMRHSPPNGLCFSMAVSLSILAASAAHAAPMHRRAPASAWPAMSADRRADIEARHDVALSFAQLPADSRYGSLARLDGAEIALLNGQSDYGPLLTH